MTRADERTERALLTHARVVTDAEAKDVRDQLGRECGRPGRAAFDLEYGELWARDGLAVRDRALAVVSILALRPGELLRGALVRTGWYGLTTQDLEEIAGFVTAYAGLEIGLAAARDFRMIAGDAPVVPTEPTGTDAERYYRAHEVFARLLGLSTDADPDAGYDALVERLGPMATVGYPWIFGEIWADSALPPRECSVIVLSLLAAQGVQREIRTHVGAAVRHGLSRPEIEEIILCVAMHAGFPRAVDAWYLTQEHLAELSV